MDPSPSCYERPTDELRVVTRLIHGGAVVTGVQRKWLVQDGERYEKQEGTVSEANEMVVGFSRYEEVSSPPARRLQAWWWLARVKPVWRDLPAVTEGRVALGG